MIKKEKNIYIDFADERLKKVKLTQEDIDKLNNNYGATEAEDMILNLGLYIGSGKDRYTNHYLTLLAWDRKNKRSQSQYQSKKITKQKGLSDEELEQIANKF